MSAIDQVFLTAIKLNNDVLFFAIVFLLLDDDKLELEMKSDLNSDVWNLIPNVEDHHRHLQQLLDHVLDQRVAMTDMKYRHIVSKLIVVILSLFMPKLLSIHASINFCRFISFCRFTLQLQYFNHKNQNFSKNICF